MPTKFAAKFAAAPDQSTSTPFFFTLASNRAYPAGPWTCIVVFRVSTGVSTTRQSAAQVLATAVRSPRGIALG